MIQDASLLQNILLNDFFHDFIEFLKYVEKQSIRRTITGNISLSDIAALQKQFRQQKVFDEYKKFGWRISSERNIHFLTQIKILAEIMYVTYKRKGKILLSKNGGGYLHNIDQFTQYWNMVLHYWKRANWEYFSPSPDIKNISVMNILQNDQNLIWSALIKKDQEWIEFDHFCQTLKVYFKLENHYKNLDAFSLYLDIAYGLIKQNLALFGCIEYQEKKDKYNFDRIVRFRSTKLGLFMFQKALN